ncbi:MAG: phosphate ABC transporter ATP-binding protein [Polyangiales bacterium]
MIPFPRGEAADAAPAKFTVRGLSCFYGEQQVLFDVEMALAPRRVTALIGPSGCGKSTFLRVLNRMNETREGTRTTGTVTLDGEDIHGPDVDVQRLRRRVAMVFQQPRVFPGSVFENVAYGLRVAGETDPRALSERVETALRRAGLWDELRDRLPRDARALATGEQQRLCVARALAAGPEVLLLDDPTATLDPIATARIEELISDLRESLTVVVVTHAPQQAARVSQSTAFFDEGRLVEVGDTRVVFTRPRERRTQDYLTGRY